MLNSPAPNSSTSADIYSSDDTNQEKISQALLPYETSLDKVIQASTLENANVAEQEKNILDAFNAGNKLSLLTPSLYFGIRIGRDEYRLVHRNNTPQLVAYTEYPMRLKWSLTSTIQNLGRYKKTDLYFGAHGRYVVNVKPGFFVKAWKGNDPILLGPGPHVIMHTNFSLPRNAEVPQNDAYIQHGNYHILRVPQGKIAKTWLGTTPLLLESRDQPYVFNTPLFRLEKKSNNELFENADEQVITHGALKRLLPRTGSVALTYNAGNLEIVKPSTNGKAMLITSPTHSFKEFLEISTQTLTFPSEETQTKRKQQGEKENNHILYEVFRTKDGCDIGVKLLVVYHIKSPEEVLRKLGNPEAIVPHIENIVVADMGNAIQQCTSQDFMSTDQTKTRPTSPPARDGSQPSAPEFYRNLQDLVKNKLTDDFGEYGIQLERVNIETPIVLKMSTQSELFSKTNTEVANLDQQKQIAVSKAERDAATRNIQQDQENAIRISKARAELEAATQEAEATKKRADADAYSALKKAEAEVAGRKLLAEVFKNNPALFQYQLATLQADAIKSMNTTVISPEVAAGLFALGSNNLFFRSIQSNSNQSTASGGSNANDASRALKNLGASSS